MLVLPNMGLVRWENINDNFSHEQLASNFSLLDEHDHTAGKGKQIPYGGLGEQSVGFSNLRADAITGVLTPMKWYPPKVIATEQTRESTSFGVMTTADEVPGVLVKANTLVVMGHASLVKSSVSAAGRAAIFVEANQLKTPSATAPAVQEASTTGTGWNTLMSASSGLGATTTESFVTTGEAIATTGGVTYIFNLPAGTYNFGIRFKSTSGNVTAKERQTWVYTLGS